MGCVTLMPDPNNLPTCECISGNAPSLGEKLDNIYCQLSAVATLGVGGQTGNMAWVDPVNGVNATAEVGQINLSFLTLEAARDAASAGDVIQVLPGSYAITTSLAKDGVNWFFYPGAVVTMAENGSTVGIWDDGGAAMTFKVGGYGQFFRTVTAGGTALSRAVFCSHASSDIRIDADIISNLGAGTKGTRCISLINGKLYVKARKIIGGSFLQAVIWWENGEGHIFADDITGLGTTPAAYLAVAAASTGDLNVTADNITSSGNPTISEDDSDASGVAWFTAKTIRNTSASGGSAAIGFTDSGRLYVTAQKIFGTIEMSAGATATGQLYVTADKVSATRNGSAANANLYNAEVGGLGTARIAVMEFDPNGFTGATFLLDGSTNIFMPGSLIGGTATGPAISTGTADFQGFKIDTSANNATNPFTKSGGVLRLTACRLIAEATRDSIEAGAAQNVVAMGSWANTAVDANVTITTGATGLTVDADVA